METLERFQKKSHKVEKIEMEDALISSGFAKTRKSFWLKPGLELANNILIILLLSHHLKLSFSLVLVPFDKTVWLDV